MKNLLSIAITLVFLVTTTNSHAINVSTPERIASLTNEYLPVSFYSPYELYIVVTNGKRDEYRAFKVDALKMEVTESDVKTASNNHPFAINFNYSVPLAPRFRDQPFALVNAWYAKYRYDGCDVVTNICSKLIMTLSNKDYATSERIIAGKFDSRKKLADPQWVGPTLIFKSYSDDLVDGVLAIDTDKNEIIKYFSNNEDGVFSGTFVSLIETGSWWPLEWQKRSNSIPTSPIILGSNTGLYVFDTHMKEVISCYFIKEQNEKLKGLKCVDPKFTDVNKKM